MKQLRMSHLNSGKFHPIKMKKKYQFTSIKWTGTTDHANSLHGYSGFDLLQSEGDCSLVRFQPFDFCHLRDVGAQPSQPFFSQGLDSDVLEEGVQRHTAVHPCVTVGWEDVVRSTGVVTHALGGPLSQEN